MIYFFYQPKYLNVAGELARTLGRYGEAEPLLKLALEIWEKVLGPNHPNLVIGLLNYAYMLREMERGEEADRLEKRAKAIREKHAQ